MKINQKLGKESYAKLQQQLKSKGLKVIKHVTDGFVTSDDVIGRVSDVFNLGKKLDFITDVEKKIKGGTFSLATIQGDYYLMQDAH